MIFQYAISKELLGKIRGGNSGEIPPEISTKKINKVKEFLKRNLKKHKRSIFERTLGRIPVGIIEDF